MVDESRLAKIEALLRKAESTEYPEEAQSLTEKAEALMTKWAIDAAMLRAEETTSDPASHVTKWEVVIWKGPTLAPLVRLLSRIVNAHDCQCVYWNESRFNEAKGRYQQCRRYQVYGMPEDLTSIEMLYASLQIQAANEYLSEDVKANKPRGSGPGYKNSFMQGFADGAGQRLADSRKRQVEYEGSTALVLMDQARIVKQVFQTENPNLGRAARLSGGSSGAGYGAGYEAGQNADVGVGSLNR